MCRCPCHVGRNYVPLLCGVDTDLRYYVIRKTSFFSCPCPRVCVVHDIHYVDAQFIIPDYVVLRHISINTFQTTNQLRQRYSDYLDVNGYTQSPLKTNAFDAVWAASKALHASIDGLQPNETLDQFSYDNERMAKLFYDSIKNLQFQGASVRFGWLLKIQEK